MKFFVFFCIFFIPLFNSLSFMKLFQKPLVAPAKKIKIYKFLHSKNIIPFNNTAIQYTVSNKKINGIMGFPFKHDLDFKEDCQMKQGFLLEVKRLILLEKNALQMDFEQVFVQATSGSFSVFENEKVETLQESYGVKDIESSLVEKLGNITKKCFETFFGSNHKTSVYKVFCCEDEMFVFI